MKKLILLCSLIFIGSSTAEGETRNEKLFRVLKRNASRCLSTSSKKRIISCRTTNRKSKTLPSGYCYRYVKIGLLSSGLTKKYMGGRSAYIAGKYLKREGFKDIYKKSSTPYNAPIGSVLVYSGGRYGHIEVRTGKNEYVSDYIGDKPVSKYLNLRRKLKGVWVK